MNEQFESKESGRPIPFRLLGLIAASVCWSVAAHGADDSTEIRDRTLVAWVANSDVQQRGTGAFTIQNGANVFDGLIYGEIRPQVWMAGSDYFRRTERDQSGYPEETVSNK